jgi:hypothetical protein
MGISTLSVRMLAEPLRSLGFASISGTYMGIGTPLVYPSRLLFIQNLTDAQMLFSFDGVNDHFTLPASSNFVFDITTNQQHESGIYFSVGTRLYVKEVGSPSMGSVYVSTFYGSNL